MRSPTARRLAVAAALAAVAATGSVASALTAKLDPVHSMVVFRVPHSGASQPFGIFHGIEGTVTADSGEAPPSSVQVVAHVAKLDMGNDAWEKHIKSADFFNAAQFPDITFKSTAVKAGGDDGFEVTGDLTLHGVTKSMTVGMKRLGIGKGMQGETRIGYTTEFRVKRSEFGMNKLQGAAGDEVTLYINLEGVVAK